MQDNKAQNDEHMQYTKRYSHRSFYIIRMGKTDERTLYSVARVLPVISCTCAVLGGLNGDRMIPDRVIVGHAHTYCV